MILVGYLISFLILFFRKINFITSVFLSFILFSIISYIFLLVYNFLGFSGLFAPGVFTLVTIYLLTLTKDFHLYESLLEIKKDKYFYFFLTILLTITILGLYGGDFSYDGKAYHIDAIYGLYSHGNILNNNNFSHFYAKVYPKLGDYILGSFGDVFKYINISYYFLGNIVTIFLLYTVAYNISKSLGIKSESNRSLIALFVALNPIIMYEATTGLGDIVFVFFLISSIYIMFLNYTKFYFLLFILLIVGIINVKYSGPFLGFILCTFYLLKNLPSIKYKDYLLLLIFLPGFIFYLHNYIEFGTPLYPFFNSSDLNSFFRNLSHAPAGVNGNTLKEMLYSNIFTPHFSTLRNLRNLEIYNIKSILKTFFLGYFRNLNNYGSTRIFILPFIPFYIYSILKNKNKTLIMFSLLIIILYFMQSLKWEVRYFIYIILFGYIGFFYILERNEKLYLVKKAIVVVNISFILFYTLSVAYAQLLTHNVQTKNHSYLINSEKIFFFEKTDYTYLFYYSQYILDKKLIVSNKYIIPNYKFRYSKDNELIDINDLHNSVIIWAPSSNKNIEEYLIKKGYEFIYDKEIGFIVK